MPPPLTGFVNPAASPTATTRWPKLRPTGATGRSRRIGSPGLSRSRDATEGRERNVCRCARASPRTSTPALRRSEEHTSELQSHVNLVCRLLLEKKKKKTAETNTPPSHITTLPLALS